MKVVKSNRAIRASEGEDEVYTLTDWLESLNGDLYNTHYQLHYQPGSDGQADITEVEYTGDDSHMMPKMSAQIIWDNDTAYIDVNLSGFPQLDSNSNDCQYADSFHYWCNRWADEAGYACEILCKASYSFDKYNDI